MSAMIGVSPASPCGPSGPGGVESAAMPTRRQALGVLATPALLAVPHAHAEPAMALEGFSGVRISLSAYTGLESFGRSSELLEHALDHGLAGN